MTKFDIFLSLLGGAIIVLAIELSVSFMQKVSWCEERGLIPVRSGAWFHNVICIDPKIIIIPNLKEKQ